MSAEAGRPVIRCSGFSRPSMTQNRDRRQRSLVEPKKLATLHSMENLPPILSLGEYR